ncbi:MAG TPA: ATP-binding cassette domain-containing protein, partial [Nitrosospira sp.]|nr:ATP-binding cassette domain-containing protein [Nitrosospira sp.]
MPEDNCIIEVEGLYTRFGNHVVHENIGLCVQCGEVLTLVGGSGSGKTALMRQML